MAQRLALHCPQPPVPTHQVGESLLKGEWCDSSFFDGADNSDIRSAHAGITVKNAGRVRIERISVRWPVYPVPEDWLLLGTAWPHIVSPNIYDGKIDAIRSGSIRPTFKVLWARGARDSVFDLAGLTDSEGGDPVDIRP